MRMKQSVFLTASALLTFGTVAQSAPAPFSHVFVIVLENHSLRDVIGNPNLPALNRLAREGALAANYTGVAHPSLPNYVALIAGSTFGSRGDNPRQKFAGDNLALQLEAAHKTWRGYMQGLPSPGSNKDFAGQYAKKHDPFMLFPAIADDPERAANVVPIAQLGADLKNGKAPDFALIVPDLCHDLHGGPGCPRGAALEKTGDDFVRDLAEQITRSTAWDERAALVVTFDEGEGGDAEGGGGRIATVVLTKNGPRGVVSDAPYNHYSLLRALEDNWNLPLLGEAKQAKPMTDLFGK